MKGYFIISLDFELMWGVRDSRTIDSYGKNILNVHSFIPKILKLCDQYDISISFATVGMLFAENSQQLKNYIPTIKPDYSDKKYSPYEQEYIPSILSDASLEKYHFARDLIKLIKANGKHELCTHTFSHFYTLEEGSTIQAFNEDLVKAKKIAEDNGINMSSIVFPRNQYSQEHIDASKLLGFNIYRGNEDAWWHNPSPKKKESLLKRLVRLTDAYINLGGRYCYPVSTIPKNGSYNVASSRFLRPYNKKLAFLEFLKFNRISKAMEYAAINNQVYHLWFHPHNFGQNIEKNFKTLEDIFKLYKKLQKSHDFENVTMKNIINT